MTSFAAEPLLPQLFKQAKEEFARGEFAKSLADFDQLQVLSIRPEFESDRARLAPAVAFYRAANLASLGRREEAKDSFVIFLALTPNASIESPPFSRVIVDVFREARSESAGKANTIAAVYMQFATPSGWSLPADEHWIDSPVRYLLTPAQKKEYATFTTAAERQTFVDRFWTQLDPTPATEENEFRREFERRIAFADVHFSTPTTRGRETDRAIVFALFGPPSYASTASLSAGDDAIANLRNVGSTPLYRGGTSNSTSTAAIAALSGAKPSDNLESEGKRGTREAWVYRRGRISSGLPYSELRFDFISKEGYGDGVLQKDTLPMQALGQAAEIARNTKVLH